MKLSVIGAGYVGLVAAACFAENGNDVVAVDRDPARLRLLRRGAIPFVEPGLEEIVRRNRAEKRLVFTSQVATAARHSSIVFIAVEAASSVDGEAAAQGVLDAAREVAQAMNGYKVLAIASAVPVGTAAKAREVVRRETTHPFSVVSSPAFLRQGTAVRDFLEPDRVVIGAEDPRATQLLVDLYSPFTRTGAPVLVMDCASAELSKLAASALLAARISLMNEVARVAELAGADVEQVRRAVGADHRIGPACLFAGAGYGGANLAGDVRTLMALAAGLGYGFRALEAAERVNAEQKEWLACRMQRHFGSLEGRVIAVWGLAFKPGTGDVREAPALALVERLLAAGARVQVYDPAASSTAKAALASRVKFCARSYDALVGADALGLVTEWNEFREPDLSKMRKLMRAPVVFDGRNLYRPERMRAHGFTYYGVGR
ncbi:MAG TPA: UDP-glucose/GDP-mannose dehydrogenase family protein [Vicinamibacterales bacterium]|nr:UDP-glucose/GDP-mannose dehydrogenase family protein [Acidobacteriota bacterium]HOC17585.1 UDP-glucose/GDP-mannose dehydrogenase family protein [Vicinamibacterales bacterium]